MPGYVDSYVLPVPRKNLSAYRKLAREWGSIMRGYGMLRHRECVGKDLYPKGAIPFPSRFKLKKGEVLIFSVVEFRSKAQRDRAMKKAMKDPRFVRMTKETPPFDCKRMAAGGFSTVVDVRG